MYRPEIIRKHTTLHLEVGHRYGLFRTYPCIRCGHNFLRRTKLAITRDSDVYCHECWVVNKYADEPSE